MTHIDGISGVGAGEDVTEVVAEEEEEGGGGEGAVLSLMEGDGGTGGGGVTMIGGEVIAEGGTGYEDDDVGGGADVMTLPGCSSSPLIDMSGPSGEHTCLHNIERHHRQGESE